MFRQVAFRVFGWPPAAFWDATPSDFASAWDAHNRGREKDEPMGRGELEDMMRRFPDGG